MTIVSVKKYQIALLVSFTIALVVASARLPMLHWLSFFWILPFAFLLPKLQLKEAAIISAFCATAFWVGTSYWLVAANIYFANSVAIPVAVVFLLFCLWQAIPYMVLAISYSYFNWNNSSLGPLLAASALTIAWAALPSPLPWIPQNSLYIYPKFVALLDLSGMSLLLFVSTLCCFAIEYSLRKTGNSRKYYMVLAASIPVLMLVYGEVRQMQLDRDKAEAGQEQWLHVGYIQPALRYEERADRAYRLTEQLIREKSPDLIVWPEITAPYSFIDNRMDRDKTLQLVNQYRQNLIVMSGYVDTGERLYGSPATYYNQAQLIKGGRLQGRYSKEILVPFFEYMPAPLSFLRQWMPRVLYYEAGKSQPPLQYKADINLIMAVCYEIIFPQHIRRQVQQGGNIIINPANDAVFEEGIGHYYHLSTAYFRSIENRIPWVRSTNTGFSLIVDADGTVLTPVSKLGEVAIDSAKVFLPNKTSVYSRFNDWFFWFLCAVCLAYALSRMGRGKR